MAACGMWTVVVGLLAVGAGPVESTPRPQLTPAAQQQLSKLQGTWRALKLQVGGRTVDVPGRSKKDPGVSLEIHGDRYEFRGLGADLKGQIRIDAASKPKRLELARDDGQITLNTYRLEGDSLKLTGATADATAQARPTTPKFGRSTAQSGEREFGPCRRASREIERRGRENCR